MLDNQSKFRICTHDDFQVGHPDIKTHGVEVLEDSEIREALLKTDLVFDTTLLDNVITRKARHGDLLLSVLEAVRSDDSEAANVLVETFFVEAGRPLKRSLDISGNTSRSVAKVNGATLVVGVNG